MRKNLKKLLILLMVVLLVAGGWTYVPAPVHYHIREAYSFRAGDHDARVRLAVMIPTSGPYQEVRNVSVSWDGTEAREPQSSVEVVKLVGRVNARQVKVGTIAFDVVLRQGKARWEGPVKDFQLQPQPGIEADAPAIVQAASRIAAGQSREDAYRIHKFTAGWLSWGPGISTNREDAFLQPALEAYQCREGVCGHFANLMTALCRAAKIPAQSISGLKLRAYPPLWSATGAAFYSPAMLHGWVEFHTPEGWELADPSWACGNRLKSLTFGRSDGGYLSYGERIEQGRISKAMKDWAWANKRWVVGAMEGPLRFAWAADANVSFSPQAAVQVRWSGRWFSVLAIIGVFVTGGLLNRWRQKRRAPPNKGASPNSLPEG